MNKRNKAKMLSRLKKRASHLPGSMLTIAASMASPAADKFSKGAASRVRRIQVTDDEKARLVAVVEQLQKGA